MSVTSFVCATVFVCWHRTLPFSTCVCSLVKDEVTVTPTSGLDPGAIAGIVVGAVAFLGKF